MSHHASGSNFGFPRGDARLDMTDLYVFTKPGDPAKSIMILNAHPSVFVNPPGPTTTEPFAPGALYEVVVAGANYVDAAFDSQDTKLAHRACRRRLPNSLLKSAIARHSESFAVMLSEAKHLSSPLRSG